MKAGDQFQDDSFYHSISLGITVGTDDRLEGHSDSFIHVQSVVRSTPNNAKAISICDIYNTMTSNQSSSGLASFLTPLRNTARNSDDSQHSPPTSWRKRIADRWSSSAPASSFFSRQRSALTETSNPQRRSDHLRNLLLRQVLSRRILSSYDDRLGVDEDEIENGIVPYEQGVEIVASTPRTSNRSDLVQEYSIQRLEPTIEDYTDDYVEQIRKSVFSNEAVSQRLRYVHSLVQSSFILEYPLQVKLSNVTISKHSKDTQKIKTVYNSSCLYPIIKGLKRSFTGELADTGRLERTRTKHLLKDIQLCLNPGNQYLVLGAPGSGKTSLLKAIAGLLSAENITYNDRNLSDGEFFIRNAVSYIDSSDLHASRLTVQETLGFAFECLHGHHSNRAVKLALATLGLEDVKDSYVGGDTSVRGISGGQRRRVTVGELLMSQAPVLCGDECTTGLDASAAYDMLEVILHYSRLQKQTKVFALLQPSPETVSLFDEIIVLCESQIIYSGSLEHVEQYFANIGYRCPEFMDIADFLTMVGNCTDHYVGDNTAPSPSQLAELFRQSDIGKAIVDDLSSPSTYVFTERESSRHSVVSKLADSRFVKRRYANPFYKSCYVIAKRFLRLWIRDKRVIIAGAAKNILMGASVGGVFFNTTDALSIHGALFQAGLFIMLGSMQNSTALLTDRLIFYKHTDASFYSAWPFAFGRSLAQIPQILFDTFTFATILYFMIGLGDRGSAGNFFTYLGTLFAFAILMNAKMNMYASFVDSSRFQVYAACTLLLMMLFGGFIIPPNVIPAYYLWVHWWNPFAWAYRALIVNEFRSKRWEDSNQILQDFGFSQPTSGEAYQSLWITYAAVYMTVYIFVCVTASAVGLSFVRSEQDPAVDPAEKMDRQLHTVRTDGSSSCSEDSLEMRFTPVTLSFHDLSYVVTSTATKEPLKLLQNVNGILRPGRMCALMVSPIIKVECSCTILTLPFLK